MRFLVAFLFFAQTAFGAFPGSFPSSLGDIELASGAAGVSSVFHDQDDGVVQYCGGNDTASGACMKMFGASHATQANDIEFTDSLNTVLTWDDSADAWELGDSTSFAFLVFKAGAGNQGVVQKDEATGSLALTGSNSTTNGGNAIFFGGSHASAGWHLRQGSTIRIESDATGLGFFAVAPVAKQAAITADAGSSATAVNAIITALENYGLLVPN